MWNVFWIYSNFSFSLVFFLILIKKIMTKNSSFLIRERKNFHRSVHSTVQAMESPFSLGSLANGTLETHRPESSLSWVLRISETAFREDPTTTSWVPSRRDVSGPSTWRKIWGLFPIWSSFPIIGHEFGHGGIAREDLCFRTMESKNNIARRKKD
jgi:hypothetical protein